MKTKVVHIGLGIGRMIAGCDDRHQMLLVRQPTARPNKTPAWRIYKRRSPAAPINLSLLTRPPVRKSLTCILSYFLKPNASVWIRGGYRAIVREDERRAITSQRPQAESLLVPFLTVVGGACTGSAHLGILLVRSCATRALDTDSTVNGILISELVPRQHDPRRPGGAHRIPPHTDCRILNATQTHSINGTPEESASMSLADPNDHQNRGTN